MVSDTQPEVDAYVKGVTLFSSALDQWLPCYSSTFIVDNSNSGQRLSSGEYGSFLLLFRELTVLNSTIASYLRPFGIFPLSHSNLTIHGTS